jgi:hypothetical protein
MRSELAFRRIRLEPETISIGTGARYRADGAGQEIWVALVSVSADMAEG